MSAGALFLAVFLACAVEAVEATTIVLAAGTARDWRSAILGLFAGVGVLAVIVAALGPAISAIPLSSLRLAVGGLLLVFGLQWLRKAILRASGHKALHDEAQIYLREVAAAEEATAERRGGVPDWYAFTLSFKGVVLEGSGGGVHRLDVRKQPARHPAGCLRRRLRHRRRGRCWALRSGPPWPGSRRTP